LDGQHEAKGIAVKTFDVDALTASWTALTEALGSPLRSIHSKGDLDEAVEVVDSLLEMTGGDPEHPLQDLVALFGELIEVYETKVLGETVAPPADVLRLLMEANSLTQADLADEVGGQSVVSAILNGRRTINARQAGALAARFGVSAAAFIAKPKPTALQEEIARPQAPREHFVPVQNIVMRKKVKFVRRTPLPKDIPTVDEHRPSILRMLSHQQSTPGDVLTVNFH
jgi:HTH-type transcriptional regulator/antitoxin HigA